MDEEISIIDSRTREEKIKNLFINNKKKIFISLFICVIIICSFFGYNDYKDKQRKKIAEKFNIATIKYDSSKEKNKKELINIINQKDSVYSPLALYYLIENGIVSSKKEVNEYFDKIINEVKLEKEVKNLIIYKKALFNSDFEDENSLLIILNPVIKSDSVWRSHALYLLGEYYLHNNQKEKAKEFYEQILTLNNSNNNIISEVQKRLQSEYSE